MPDGSDAAFLASAAIAWADQVVRLAIRPIARSTARRRLAWAALRNLGSLRLLYIPLYTACVFCACCPRPLRRRKLLAQVQGRVWFSDFGDMLFSWDKVAHSGNISKAFVLLRRGVLSSANGRLPVLKTGASLARTRAAIDRRSAASMAIWVFVI